MSPDRQFDPTTPTFRADPYPFYHQLREHAPVVYLTDWRMWFLTRHVDVSLVLKDSRFVRESGPRTFTDVPPSVRALVETQANWMLFRDPPDHTRLRGLVHKAFTPTAIRQMQYHIMRLALELLDSATRHHTFDLMTEFAYPLPVIVITEMLGVPPADRDRFKGWSRDLADTLDLDSREETYVRGSQATEALNDYLRHLIDRRRADPQDDLMSALIAAEEDGAKLTESELVATVVFLLVAGHETTMNLIGNGVLALLRHPDQLEILRNNPELMKTAIEELLRYDSPVQFTSRIARVDVEIDGVRIAAGDEVGVSLGAANRDPAVFNNPDELAITRQQNAHVAFGSGIHFCIGAPLARLEGQIALRLLLERCPTLHLTDAVPAYRERLTLRGLQRLEVAL
jgi:cytochrome P450